MGTDWLVKVRCPYPEKDIDSEEEHIKQCSSCPYVIWEKPESIAGFMHTMCGVRVGNVYRAAELDDMGQKLTEIKWFTKEESSPAVKRDILEQIKNHAIRTGWSIKGFSTTETIDWLDMLIEFCKRVEQKGLEIHVWA